MPVCLQEIRECRPYFIGLLGERYGFVPEPDAALIEAEPWLARHRGKSVTELEILHGVLDEPAMADHAFFYFRDPAYKTPATVDAGAPGDQEKLAALKARIRQSGLPVHENYANPRELGQLVLDDFTQVIDRLFPAGLAADCVGARTGGTRQLPANPRRCIHRPAKRFRSHRRPRRRHRSAVGSAR